MVPCGLALGPCVAGCRAVIGPVPHRHSPCPSKFLVNNLLSDKKSQTFLLDLFGNSRKRIKDFRGNYAGRPGKRRSCSLTFIAPNISGCNALNYPYICSLNNGNSQKLVRSRKNRNKGFLSPDYWGSREKNLTFYFHCSNIAAK